MKLIFSVLLLTSLAFPAFAQSESAIFNHTTGSLAKWQRENPIEKVHLHLDKSYYAAGDDIWFKAYVIAGSKHELSGVSSVLNVELIDYNGLVKQYIKLPLVSGLTWGDFKLPDTLSAGNYRIVAYTNWMRNAGSAYFFDRTIYIGNAIMQDQSTKAGNLKSVNHGKRQTLNKNPGPGKVNIQFFPESGSLVYGIESRIAFKAVGADGSGKDITGLVVDDQNHEVSRFSSRHLGMGAFTLQPVSGKTYKAFITYADGSKNSVDLPVPLISGYVLHVDNTDPLYIEIKIEAGPGLGRENDNGGINLIAQSNGEIYYAARSKSMRSFFTTTIPKSKFPSGIVQFTLFSLAGEPLNERLVFVQNPDELNLSIAASGNIFARQGKTKVGIEVKNEQGKPVFGNFSVSVIDETKVPVDETAESTIISNLLLTSDIKGYVEKPNYYFTSINERTREDLDVLMLTQGYRRFQWKQILNNTYPPIVYEPENSLAITGRLKTLGDKPLPNGKVSLLSSSQGFFMLDTVSDSQGYFAFKNLQFKDSVKFVVQSRTNKNKTNVKIEMDTIAQMPVVSYKSLASQKMDNDTVASAYLTNSKKIYDEQIKYGIGNHPIALREVKIKEKKILPNSSNLNGPGNADQVLLAKDINTGCATIANCLGVKLTGVFFQYDMYGVGHPATYRHGIPVSIKVKVDGFTVDAETLNSLPPEIVESVEVLRSGAFTSIYGGEGYNGLILINTKKGSFIGGRLTSNIVSFIPKGYYKAREFYSPQYDDPKVNKQIAGLRTTIYWNPNIATDKNGKASFEYFNADDKGTYRVVMEGIDEKGHPGRQVYRYKVE
ncbi:MAG: TonB-dependent receptor [Mucilaginibacter sp.]|nr:TonB-dependent receptor [Mucilaginibacter sp.]